jgi:hypothetical protein
LAIKYGEILINNVLTYLKDKIHRGKHQQMSEGGENILGMISCRFVTTDSLLQF